MRCGLICDLSSLSFYFLEVHHLKDFATLEKYKSNHQKAFSASRVVQTNAPSKDFCSSSTETVTTEPASFGEEACYLVRSIETAPAALRQGTTAVPTSARWRSEGHFYLRFGAKTESIETNHSFYPQSDSGLSRNF